VSGGGNVWGAGIGLNYKQTPLSYGLTIERNNPGFGGGDTEFILGAMYRFAQRKTAPVRVSLVAFDVFNNSDGGPWYDAGVAWPYSRNLLLAADMIRRHRQARPGDQCGGRVPLPPRLPVGGPGRPL